MAASSCSLPGYLPFALARSILQARATSHPSGRLVQQIRCLAAPPQQITVTASQKEQMQAYIHLLMEQNEVMNLTAVPNAKEAWSRHVEDSLALLPVMEQHAGSGPQRVIDVGSGAGLPGLILAMARPHWQVTLLDSLQKRCRFVEDVVRQLGVGNVEVVWSRAEAAGRDPTMREAFDLAVARAVAEMRVLVELSLPLVKVDGHLVAAKGPNPQVEVAAAERAIPAVGGRLVGSFPVASHGPEGQRVAVVVQKVGATPAEYPRREGRPNKKPL